MMQKIMELLNKQKLVDSLLHNQAMPHRDRVETLVHTQHLAELRTRLERLSATEIGEALSALPLEDAKQLWHQVADDRQDDILWELADDRREALVGPREPHDGKGQMNAFELVNGRLCQVTITCRQDLAALHPIWIDLRGASKGQRHSIGQYYGLDLPDPDEATDLEVSARFYVEENDEVHLHSNFLLDREGESRSVPVAFILHHDILFTVRNEELPVFRLQRLRARNQPGYVSDAKDVLLDLYGADIEYSADALEDIYTALGRVGHHVLSKAMTDAEASALLAEIAEQEDLNGRIRRNILDTQRMVSFLMRGRFISSDQVDDAKEILRDIESLNSHTAFLFEKINFLLDATIGFININQNQRLSVLTTLTVVFMPINMLAGMGGMSEFSMMTQGIPWPLAYGAFTVGMGLIGWLTFLALRSVERRRARGFLVERVKQTEGLVRTGARER
ncbi:magnesium and cobalt transport protein CorA [Thiocystis violacea]|uniref:magnesium and cobalt transport protein CorA n=1 Tax=Thiocystis violacea TaxID=13725 RepID=UPI00190645CA|nr:magnesium and cobalt transport protein CorA [Thiocystis violacea]MBK1717243.1 magnesium transporter CorA [Thiocystis violacea]